MGTLGNRMSRENARTLMIEMSILVEENDRFYIRMITAGSYLRGLEDLGDLDLIVVTNSGRFDWELLNFFKSNDDFIVKKAGERQITLLTKVENHQIDLYCTCLSDLGAMTLFLTGPAKFNVMMRKRAKAKGLKLSQYSLYQELETGNKSIASRTEEEIFLALDMKYIEPKDRR